MRAAATAWIAWVWLAAAAACSDPPQASPTAADASVAADSAAPADAHPAPDGDGPDDATHYEDSASLVEVTILEVAPADGTASDGAPTADAGPADAATATADGNAGEIAMAECATAADCPATGAVGACTTSACVGGHCTTVPLAEGTVCGSVGACVQLTCSSTGACSVPIVAACPAPPCWVGICEVSNGACGLAAAATGACDDGDPCTLGEHCAGGACTGASPKPCPSGPCTAATCDPTSGKCAAAPLPSGAPCTDGNPCTLQDGCDGAGSCQSGTPTVCSAPACQTATCDVKTGICVTTPLDATPCDDGQPCTSGDTCAAGTCAGGAWTCACQFDADCDDASPCTTDTCVAGSCSQLPGAATACDDGNACTVADKCLAGACLPGSATSCDDGNACTADACAPATGQCTSTGLSETACDDGDLCTVGEGCSQGTCVGGVPVACPDDGVCLVHACVPATGLCGAVELAGPCTGSDLCVVGQTCQGGQCQGGAPVACDDGNPCTADTCLPATGTCQFGAALGAPACGANQYCAAGSCACALGWFAVPTDAKELLRAVVATGTGFAAVGDSSQAVGQKGLFVLADAANHPLVVQRVAAGGPLSFAAVAVATGGGFWTLAEFADGWVRLVQLDGIGNVQKVVPLFPAAQAQALAAVDNGVLALANDAWAPGGATRMALLDGAGNTLWTKTISPTTPDQVALGTAAVVSGAQVVIAGQDAAFAAPGATELWLATASLSGPFGPEKTSLSGPPGGLIGAAALAGGHLWLGGQVVQASLQTQSDLLLRVAWPLPAGLPGEATVVASTPGAAEVTGLAPLANGLVAVGWRTVAGAPAATAGHWTDAGPSWTATWTAKGGQSLRAVAVLADGTAVAVGSRAAAAGGHEAVWLRVAASGAIACN